MADWTGQRHTRDRLTVLRRHHQIVRLRSTTDMPLKTIALAVGLNDHSSVIHHLNGKCRCDKAEGQ